MKLKCFVILWFNNRVGVLHLFKRWISHFEITLFEDLFLRVFCISQMRHGRLFSRPNCPEISHMCLLFVPKVGKKNSTEMVFWSAMCVLGGHIWNFSCIPCKFFVRYSLITLTPCVSHLPCMCLEFSAGKTVGGKRLEKFHPALKWCLCSSAWI